MEYLSMALLSPFYFIIFISFEEVFISVNHAATLSFKQIFQSALFRHTIITKTKVENMTSD